MDYTSASGYKTDETGRRQFVDRDINNGVPGTSLVAFDLNGIVNTLMAAFGAYGIKPDASDDRLLAKTIDAAVAAEATRASTIESNLQTSKAAQSDLAEEIARAMQAEAGKISGTYGVGTSQYPGKALIKSPQWASFCYDAGGNDVWLTLVSALSDTTRSGICQAGYNFTNGHLDLIDIGGTIHSFLQTAQQPITNGTMTQIGNQEWQAFYIDNISGTGALITFPHAFSAKPALFLQPTNEVGTNLAISANPVEGSLSNSSVQVNINNAPGVASTAGCGLWVWAFGAA